MSMDINTDRPGVSSATTIEKPKKQAQSSGRGLNVVITVVVIIVLLVVAGYLVDKYTSISLFGNNGSSSVAVDTSGYRAVFLSNGQVYFGKVAKKDMNSTVLTDIYYLQVSNPLQQAPNQQTAAQPELSLVKLGNELHGPQDEMTINNDHILFTEELKEDGRVVQAIANYVAGNQEKI